MDSLEGLNLELPSDDPTSYCRLCLSKAELQQLPSEPSNHLVELMGKQLNVILTEPDDFPCAVCTICVQKLEELFENNYDALLEWNDDEELLEYKKTCQAINLAIKNRRNHGGAVPVNDQTIVLPFQQLGNGRYKCKKCPDLVFDEISACLRHHQEIHLDSSSTSLGETNPATKRTSVVLAEASANGNERLDSAGGNLEKRPCFKCVSCSEIFDNIDKLIEHRSIHDRTIQRDPTTKKVVEQVRNKRRRLMVPGNDTKCKECNVEFPEKKAFYVHLNAIHDLNICNICDSTFSSSTVLAKHQANHRNLNDIINPFLLAKNSYHCKVCFERFRTERDIRWHYHIMHTEMDGGSEGNGTTSSAFMSANYQ